MLKQALRTVTLVDDTCQPEDMLDLEEYPEVSMPKIQNIGASTPTLVAHPTRDALAADAVTRILDIIERAL